MDEVDDVLRERRASGAQRQRRSRQLRRELAEENAHDAARIFRNREDEEVDMLNVCSISGRLQNFLLHELAACPGKRSRDAVMEMYLRALAVLPYMPEYYLHLDELATQREIILNLQRQLELVKGVQSSDKLAYRGALLHAAVSGNVHRRGQALSRMLKVRGRNITKASARRASLESTGISQFSLHKRQKHSDRIASDIVERVTDWWEQETRVSPNMKDTRHRLGGNNIISHPIHLLLETQVCLLTFPE